MKYEGTFLVIPEEDSGCEMNLKSASDQAMMLAEQDEMNYLVVQVIRIAKTVSSPVLESVYMGPKTKTK